MADAPTWDLKGVRESIDLIACCKDSLMRAQYAQFLAARIGLDYAVIEKEVEKAAKKKRLGSAETTGGGQREPVAEDLDVALYGGSSLLKAVMESLMVERPEWNTGTLRFPVHPREILQEWGGGGAWRAFVDQGWPNILGAIAESRGMDRKWAARVETLVNGGAWQPEAALDAWLEVVAPTFQIGPELFRLRYGMLPEERMMEEMAMDHQTFINDEAAFKEQRLAAELERIQVGRLEEGDGFLYWFVEEGTTEEFTRLLEAERKVQAGVWPDWSGPEDLEEWAARLPEDWREGVEDGDLASAQRVARLMSQNRCRTILGAAVRRGMVDVTTKYGTSGKLDKETS